MTVSPTKNLFRFGLFELDARAGQLRKNGTRVRLPQQPLQVLLVLLEHAGEVVTREELRKKLWAEDVFVDFDHGLNKSVQKLRDALGDSADSPVYIETIPRVGYRLLAPVSNVLDVSGVDGFDAGDLVNGNGTLHVDLVPVPAKVGWIQGKVVWLGTAGLIILLVVGAGVFHSRQLRGKRIHSIAVLPLDNLSGDSNQDYFADGMTDELTTMLAKDSTLRVVSRTSAMQFKGAHKSLREIARDLGVDGIVEGSVERAGGNVHMTLQLIEGSSDTHVWADSYDRDTNDAASLPDEAAMAIAKTTNSAVAVHRAPRYVNPAAHDAYFRGENFWYAGKNEESGRYFQRAVDLQPDYALAWVGLSKYYGGGLIRGDMDPRVALPPMLQAAQKAVSLDDSLSDAHLALCGSMLLSEDNAAAAAERECARATELDPRNGEAYHMWARVLAAANRQDEGIAKEKRATDLAPSGDEWGLARSYLWARRYDEGIAVIRQRLESNPRNAEALETLAKLYRCKGMYAEAVQALSAAFEAKGDAVSAEKVRSNFRQGGYRAVLEWRLKTLRERAAKSYVSPVWFALLYAQLGQWEKTLQALEEASRQGSPLLLWVPCDPAYDFIHADPRYRALMPTIGMMPAS